MIHGTDIDGRTIFTASKGPGGVGLTRKGSRTTPEVTITLPGGKTKRERLGWDDLQDAAGWLRRPPEATVTTEIKDDTQPGGERTMTRKYSAPFLPPPTAESDYRIAWEFFAAAGRRGEVKCYLLLAREIQFGLKQFLITAYEPSDPFFSGIMKKFTQDESRWMKGPYLQLGLPFRSGVAGRTTSIDSRRSTSGFVHQEAAWNRLASNQFGKVSPIVATGTGSGKTECFLYPILDYRARAKAEGVGGVKTLVIYPMNALASDQARRFAERIALTPAFKGVRVGLYVGGLAGKDGRGEIRMTAGERDYRPRDPAPRPARRSANKLQDA